MTSLFEDNNTTTWNKSDDNKPELALKIGLIVRFLSRGRCFAFRALAPPQIETFPDCGENHRVRRKRPVLDAQNKQQSRHIPIGNNDELTYYS